jgi:hypothetical protein
MQRAEGLLVNGISALLLSLLVWKMTGNFTAWLVFAVPGTTMIFAGWIAVLRK